MRNRKLKNGDFMLLHEIKTINDMRMIIQDIGFLPYFSNNIEGFSVEESCTQELFRKSVELLK